MDLVYNMCRNKPVPVDDVGGKGGNRYQKNLIDKLGVPDGEDRMWGVPAGEEWSLNGDAVSTLEVLESEGSSGEEVEATQGVTVAGNK